MRPGSYFDRAVRYARAVVDTAILAGRWERLACERFLRDLDRQDTEAFPYVIDERLGERACRFLELLPHIKGEWAKPVYVDGKLGYAKIRLEDWQVFCEFQVFAWVHRITRLRRFRRTYEEVARKNAKSTRAAARQLFLLTADGEPGAHCYSAATTGEQAREVFDVARNMALREPEFLQRFGVDVGKNDITVMDTASSFKPLNAEGSTLDGLNVHAGVVDEVHAHKKRDLWDVLDSATGARSQPLLSAITTAGSDRSGICYELRDYTIKVLQRVVDDETWFGIIYTIDEGDDWRDPATWRKANPNLGVSVKQDDMEAACRKAMAMPSAQANFLTKRLNVWVSSDAAWMDMMAWERCGQPGLRLEHVQHLPCWIPLDLASKVDVAAGPRLFYDEEKDHYYLLNRFWLPERAVEMGRNSQYDGWRRAGHLIVTDGEVIDFDQIEDALRADMRTLQVEEVPFDPFQATQLSSHMVAEGVPMVEYRQTVLNMSEPMKLLEALVLQGKLTHDANPMMTWMISNVVCHRDVKDNIYPRKEREENKIDGPVATIMGIGRIIAGRQSSTIEQGFVSL
ncbi:terminase TerL endonuclease subunit [uncultured Pseudacidovorax sp.]|uniref:terminase large subunit n=1 Tax=uncultured Pseudacidovorax sp. TaxID=679313 RepID=UPI0025F1CFE9|nr:terminase TerL endonuclease subunit [uncultured Pseudacidovorax sp.]